MKDELRQKRVLIVEDDPDIRSTMTEALELHGYTVISAANGQVAIDALRTLDLPDVILLDLKMPVKDGYGFRLEQTAQADWSDIPVVTMTSDGDYIDHLKRAGCKTYLRKPVDLDELLAVVEKYCGAGSTIP